MADAFFRDTGAANRNSMGVLLKQRERIRSTLQRVPSDVSVLLRDGCAFVSDQRHDNGVKNASILEQANRGVPQRVQAQFDTWHLPSRPMPREL